MTETPSESSFRESVELSEDEFRDVYSLLKMCLAVEMGIDEKSLVVDGELVARLDIERLASLCDGATIEEAQIAAGALK